MRRITVASAALLLVVSVVHGQGQPGVIRAAGSAVIYAMPDRGRIYCSMQVENRQTSAAKELLAQKVASAIAAVKALKVAGLQVSTDSFSVTPLVKPGTGARPDYSGGPGGYDEEVGVPQDIIGYRVKSSITVTVTASPERLAPAMSQIIDALSKGGTNYVTGPHFGCSDYTRAQKEGLTKATRDAVDNARAIAEGLGVTIKNFAYAGMYPETPTSDPTIGALSKGIEGDEGGPPATPTPIEIKPQSMTYAVWVTAAY
jgi:uncharacterized protein YggE